MRRIGLISDTHGLLRPQALEVLAGCSHIVHGGDIGGPEVLAALARIAPVSAVRGNNDTGPWAQALPLTQHLTLGGVTLFVLHDLKDLALHPAPPDVQVVVCGHSHRPRIAREPSGRLVVNPGSAGPRRFKLPVSVAELTVAADGSFDVRLLDLLQPGATIAA